MYVRVLILLLTITQAMGSALLGFSDMLPQEFKIGLVVLSAGIAVALNRLPWVFELPDEGALQNPAQSIATKTTN